MDGRKTGLLAGGALLIIGGLLVSCAGIGVGGYLGYTAYIRGQEQEALCLAMREATRERWLEAGEALSEQQAQIRLQIAEHEAALERATLLRDLEATDRYEGLIMTAENRLTSLALAGEAVDEMQTVLVFLPAAEIAQKARLLSEIPLDASAAAVLEGPLEQALTLQETCG